MTEPLVPGALRAHLDRALAASYVVEHELGGAGMSRVFVARELALGRQVVLKVLPPELAAGLNVERFRREIQLAAGLQHPHVVPVLAAGSADGVPYYAMPLVEGESLRARLARDGALPAAEAVHVLHDVADALAYAHGRGIVHRDVKPDNVLLSGRHALVTDFGVAKALRTAFATPGGTMDPEGTGAGLAIGTPAYMSPEQAAADPSIDHRADLYALGVLAYETLAGVPPFHGRSPAEVLTAHLAESPEPLDGRRGDLPPALVALVMRCLAKRPEDRPADATVVRDALAAVATPAAVTPGAGTPGDPRPAVHAAMRVRRRRRALLAAGIGLLATMGAALGVYRTRDATLDESMVAVAPFRVSGDDASLRYLREGMLDLLAATLTGEGGPRSADPRALLSAWRRAAGSEDHDLPRDRALDVAEGLGAGRLLTGEIAGTPGGRVVLTASLLSVRDGRARAPVRVEGSPDSLPQLVERLAVALLSQDAPGGDRAGVAARPLTSSLPALRAYLGATALYRRSRYRESAREFDRALSLDSTFAHAGLGLATSAQWFGEPDQEYRGLSAAWRERERLSPVDRVALEAAGGPAFPRFATMTELHAAKQRYARVAPDRPDALFQAADAMFHFGAVLGEPDAEARAALQFRRVLALDSTYLPALEHLVFLSARAGDTTMVREAGTLFLRGDSTAEGADGVRWRMAVALGDTAMLAELERRAATLHPVSAHLIEEISLLDGVDLERAQRIVAANAEATRAERSTSDRLAFAAGAHDVALARGQPARAAALLESMREAGQPAHLVDVLYVVDALFGDGDTTAARTALRTLEPIAYGATPATLGERLRQEWALCATELWRVAQGDARTAAQTVERLREPYRGPLPPRAESPSRHARGCAAMIEATLAARTVPASAPRPASAVAAAERLDSLLRVGEFGLLQQAGPLILARLRESLGDERGALVALRRRPYLYSRQPFLASILREEARLAARIGDRPGAERAARHYAALRAAAEPGIRDDARRERVSG